ncbi:MAG: exodeoxyribonuclease VII large subunit [bacterium]|nr:exodeoxyribonuclease VII large subunit [bacterium]
MTSDPDMTLPLWAAPVLPAAQVPVPPPAPRAPAAAPLSVSQLTRRIRLLLEGNFANVWLEGEISNFKAHPSGHYYFTLKDAQTQIPAVMFRTANRRLKFTPENGLQVVVSGSVQIYEPQGKYQIICDTLTPSGLGALQLAFEQVKQKLAAEGLFDAARKKTLPLLPRTIGVLTSASGAAIRDIIRVLTRRFPTVHLVLYPVAVQGVGAAAGIARALDDCAAINRRHERDPHAQPLFFDVLIVGRGGGSLEDLWAFNEEIVARAIARAPMPVIAAVGHEIDWTIADFVADVRAPTPSAAAEIVVQPRAVFVQQLEDARRRMRVRLSQALDACSHRVQRLTTHYVFRDVPRTIDAQRQRVDELWQTLRTVLHDSLAVRTERVARATRVVGAARRLFLERCVRDEQLVRVRRAACDTACDHAVARRHDALRRMLDCLEALGPVAVVRRGYTITRDGATGRVLTSTQTLSVAQELRTDFRDGQVRSQILAIVRDDRPADA